MNKLQRADDSAGDSSPLEEALLLAVAVNLLAALILCGVIRRRSHHLRFPANTHSLQPAVSKLPDAEKS